MADQHPIWRGHLRLALVSCPIALYSARRAAGELHFNYINPKTGNRVRMVTLDAGTDREVKRSELVRGYEFKKDTYVLLDDDDFESARIDSSSTLQVNKFVPADTIDPIYFDSSYFVLPDEDSGQDVYVVLRDAIKKSGKAALSRLVIARRERAVVLMPMENGLVLHTLHDDRELNNAKTAFKSVPDLKPDPDMVKLATQLIDRQLGRFDASDMEDRYEARLRDVIQAKLRGENIVAPDAPEDGDNVVDLMAALKKSLGQATSAKQATAKPKARAGATKRVAHRTAPTRQSKRA